MERNNAETSSGARSFKSTATVMDFNTSEEDLGWNYFEKTLSMVRFAYHKVRATNSSAFIDSILHNAQFFLLFALYLVFFCVNQVSFYQWCFYVNQLPLYQWLFYLFVLFALTLLFLYFYVNHAPFLFLEEDIKWIRKESRLVQAITKDADKVMLLTTRMGARARQIWGSRPYRYGAAIKGLAESEAAWVDKAKTTAQRAKDLVATFEKQRKTRDANTYRIRFAMISDNFQQIGELFTETKQVKQEINDIFTETKQVKQEINDSIGMKEQETKMCEWLESLLESSRSNNRRLLDRPIHEHDQAKQADVKRRVASASALTSSILEKISLLIQGRVDSTGEQVHSLNLQLRLLHPFLKEIEGIQFDSEIEEAWVEEVEEIINEAHLAFQNLQRPENRWLSAISNWRARRKLTGDIRWVNIGLEQLLERKERYSFNFIRRESSKFVYQSPHQTTDDNSVSSVVDKMNYYLKVVSKFGEVYKEVTSLCNQLGDMDRLVSRAGISEGRYNSRLAWLEQMREIVQRAVESVETYKNSGTLWRNNLFKTRAARKFSRETDRISSTIDLFMRCIKAFDIELREESSSVVGLEEDIDALVSQLTTNNEHRSVIPIVGIGGIGKTTLAKKIYNHQVVVDHFPGRAWVSLPQKSNGNAVVEEEANNNASWINNVREVLKEKRRYLLVLDNVSTTEELNTLKAEFPETSSGCKILLTTRNNILASQADSPPHKLRLRTKEESWQLLTQLVHFPPEEKKLAKEIFSKCGGLPLGLVRVGYLMSGKDVSTAEELKTVLEYIMRKDTPLVETFTKNPKDELPPYLFTCLSYFKLFPRDLEIPARRLIALWIAEDLVKESEDKRESYEDVAVKYLSELIDRGMIQVVERKHNGEVKTCRLPYALQTLKLQDRSLESLTDHYNKYDQTFGYIHGDDSNFPNRYRILLSILSFDTREGNKPGEEIGKFLRTGIAGGFFCRLQVLDLERVFRPELPNTIGRLSKLRYLGLRWTYLESIPITIGDLLNLQTLDVKHTYLHSLPGSIWKLQKLRHLYLNQSYRSKFMRQQGGGSLKNLRTLWGAFVDKDSPLKNGLEKLIDLRKLGLTFQLDQSEQKALADGIVKLKHLQSLKLRSVDEMGEPCLLELEHLSSLDNLSSLTLFGKLNPPIIARGMPQQFLSPSLVSARDDLSFPKNLTDLTLSASCLSADPMLKLEKLLNLKFLSFHSNSYIGKEMVCSASGFPQLVVLKLWKQEHLEYWDVKEEAMPNLRALEIRSCKKLNVPTGLKHLKTLTELKLTDMPQQFAAETKGELWTDIKHSPAIITVNWEEHEE